jgi:hypothetical protein
MLFIMTNNKKRPKSAAQPAAEVPACHPHRLRRHRPGALQRVGVSSRTSTEQLYEVEEGNFNLKSGWAARRAKQRWLQHTSLSSSLSVTVAEGNFRILATEPTGSSTMIMALASGPRSHEWRAPAPTPGTSTSAHWHRRQRAQAATSTGQVWTE